MNIANSGLWLASRKPHNVYLSFSVFCFEELRKNFHPEFFCWCCESYFRVYRRTPILSRNPTQCESTVTEKNYRRTPIFLVTGKASIATEKNNRRTPIFLVTRRQSLASIIEKTEEHSFSSETRRGDKILGKNQVILAKRLKRVRADVVQSNEHEDSAVGNRKGASGLGWKQGDLVPMDGSNGDVDRKDHATPGANQSSDHRTDLRTSGPHCSKDDEQRVSRQSTFCMCRQEGQIRP